MKATYSALMNSKFFNPAFNSAIFDGPVRIYFSQVHESLALKIYFALQQNFANEMQKAKQAYRHRGENVLVMIYPTPESYGLSFESDEGNLECAELGGDMVVGLNGPFPDDQLPQVLECILTCLERLESKIEVTSELSL